MKKKTFTVGPDKTVDEDKQTFFFGGGALG